MGVLCDVIIFLTQITKPLKTVSNRSDSVACQNKYDGKWDNSNLLVITLL